MYKYIGIALYEFWIHSGSGMLFTYLLPPTGFKTRHPSAYQLTIYVKAAEILTSDGSKSGVLCCRNTNSEEREESVFDTMGNLQRTGRTIVTAPLTDDVITQKLETWSLSGSQKDIINCIMETNATDQEIVKRNLNILNNYLT